jgi:WG containing repeat
MKAAVLSGAMAGSIFAAWLASGVALALEPIPVQLVARDDWTKLPSTPDDPQASSPVMTHAAVSITRYVDPDSGEPYVSEWPFDCAPEQIHRAFRLEKRGFLLGEPILVEYMASVEGAGEYSEGTGCNYRSRGRDDNFMFLLRRDDGTWIRDVHPFAGGMGGGLGGSTTVKEGQPMSLWAAVQRWCAIEEPGRYTLYCFYTPQQGFEQFGREEAYRAQIPDEVLRTHTVDRFGNLFKKGTPEKSDEYVVEHVWKQWPEHSPSPLMAEMPPEVKALLDDFTIPTPCESVRRHAQGEVRAHVQNAAAFAQFPIVIESGTPEQRDAMVETWRQRGHAALGKSSAGSDRESAAVLDGLYFVLQPFYLERLGAWAKANQDVVLGNGRYHGLGFNPNPEATAILLQLGQIKPKTFEYALGMDQNPGVMGELIELLSHDDQAVREQALHMVRKHAGGYFMADPAGGPIESLSARQMKKAQGLWRDWWARHEDDFHSLRAGICGYINTRGAFVIPPQYALARGFHDGVAVVGLGQGPFMDDTERFYIDRRGVRLDRPYSPYAFGPLRPVQVGALWGYENEKGELAIPVRYEAALEFTEGLAAVKLDGKMGFIDEHGDMVIAPAFERAFGFLDGQATVEVNGREGIIDRTGNFIFEPKYASVGHIIEGRAQFQLGDRYGFLDESGKTVIEPRFSQVRDFKDGLAWVETIVEESGPNGQTQRRQRVGFIDTAGEYVIEPKYQVIQPFAGGLAAVNTRDHQNPLWGYIDRAGAMVIPAQFSQARSFSEGLAAVRTRDGEGGKWGFIDSSGAVIIPPQFDWAGEFGEGLAPVRVASPFVHFQPGE